MRVVAILTFVSWCIVTGAQSEDQPPLIAFVGEKISFELVPNPEDVRNFYYKAKYRVAENVYGEIDRDVIEFSGAEHLPASLGFADYQYVLLFVVKIGDKYFRTGSYSWSAVYRTKAGRWAGRYNAADYMFYREHAKNPVIRPEVIDFPEDATRILDDWELEDFSREIWEPYWRLTGNRLVPVQGNYLDDLFELKKIAWLREAYNK